MRRVRFDLHNVLLRNFRNIVNVRVRDFFALSCRHLTPEVILTNCIIAVLTVNWIVAIRGSVEYSCLQGLLRSMSVTNGGQERKFVGGSMQLCDRLTANLPTGTVRLSTPVIRVDQRSGDTVTVMTGDGLTFSGEYVISAVPYPLLNRIQFQPSLSARKLQLIQSMPMGSCIKTMTYYEKPYWRRPGMSGQMASDSDMVVFCIDDTKPDGSAPCIVGFVNGAYVSHSCAMQLSSAISQSF